MYTREKLEEYIFLLSMLRRRREYNNPTGYFSDNSIRRENHKRAFP